MVSEGGIGVRQSKLPSAFKAQHVLVSSANEESDGVKPQWVRYRKHQEKHQC